MSLVSAPGGLRCLALWHRARSAAWVFVAMLRTRRYSYLRRVTRGLRRLPPRRPDAPMPWIHAHVLATLLARQKAAERRLAEAIRAARREAAKEDSGRRPVALMLQGDQSGSALDSGAGREARAPSQLAEAAARGRWIWVRRPDGLLTEALATEATRPASCPSTCTFLARGLSERASERAREEGRVHTARSHHFL